MSWLLQLLSAALLLAATSAQLGPNEENCLIENTVGCSMARPPQYMIMAPKRIRPNQVYQLFATILRMEYGQESIHVYVSIIQGDMEYANTALRFDRPSSRIMQLRMPSNAPVGQYKLRVEGKLNSQDTGNIWSNETDIEFSTKQASLFLQMSRPIYCQGQIVHFRIIPILPNMMPKYGSMIVYVDDPTGIPVRRWQGLQTNAGGIVSQSFQLSDQPNYGTWNVRVEAFGHTYRHPFTVEEFWMPRFDVNVSVPPYVMDHRDMRIKGVVLTNHTSGRPCVGNASITAFFRPREDLWNATQGWMKPYNDALRSGGEMPREDLWNATQGWMKQHNDALRSGWNITWNMEVPEYRPVKDVPVKDYYMYFAYEYRFIEYFEGRMDFEWTREQLRTIARRGGENGDLKGSEIVFFVNVTDWYSGLNRTGWAGTILFDSKIKLSWVGERIRSFKPNSLLKVQVAVSKYDGTPVPSTGTVSVTDHVTNVGSADKLTLTGGQNKKPINGIAEFEFNLGPQTQTIELTATYVDVANLPSGVNPNLAGSNTEVSTLYASRYYSPTNSYISIMTSTDHPKVNEYMILHVKTSNFVPRIYYQVISQSNIIIGDELEMTSKQKTFAIALSREMIPTARILVYYIRQPEELVIDVLNFFVNGTRQNEVRLEINRGKDFSRDTIEFNAYADPGSYVAFSGMILDLYSRGLSDGITENKLIDELMTYDPSSEKTYRQLWRVSDTEFEYKFFIGTDYGIDANTSFEHAGIVIMTDARVPRLFNEKFCRENGNENGVGYPCFSGLETQCFTPDEQCNDKEECQADGADEFMCKDKNPIELYSSAMDRVSRVMRFYDNSSWAWQEIFVKPDGRVDFRVDVPKYPLSWVINGISVSRDLGLGIMQRPVRYDAARYMYIQVEHPTHIVRGEQIGVRVTVFNYWYEDDYIEVLVTMHAGNDFEFVSVGDMGIVTSYAPVTHKGDHQTIVFLEPGESRDIYMPIVATKGLVNGQLDFMVSATCFMEKDEYSGTMFVQPDGIMNYYHLPRLIDLIRYPSIQIPPFDIPVDMQFQKPEVRAHIYVPESPTTFVSLFGDVVTPGFFEDYLNAENLLHRPYGGGEMIAFNFAYNAMTLHFMKASQQLSSVQLSRSLKQMNIALQRILSYMNPEDGSFRMFRDDPRPSLWLTAFIAKSVNEANFGEWERELFIPRELINKMVLYMCSRQNEITGAFEPAEDDVAYDRKMASLDKMKTHKMTSEPVPLTAYVLIALSELKDVSEEAATCLVTARDRAATYLSDKASSITEVFQKAITTYALSKTLKRSTFTALWEMRKNDSDYIYFADMGVPANPYSWQQNIMYLLPRQELLNDGYAVQTTAYALMAHLLHPTGQLIDREFMMAWLNNMRNSVGGMASTQDTIIALEALFKFAEVDTHRNVFDLQIKVESTAAIDWQSTMNLKKNDYIRLTKSYLPKGKVHGYIYPVAQGTGRAMLQMTTTMNVEFPNLIKPPQSYENGTVMKFFDVYKDDLVFSGRNDSIMEMTVCGSWVFTERSMTSGLAVMEVDLPTGFVAMNDSLRDYVKSNIVPNLKRAEFYGRKVVFYFDYLDTSTTCVYFRADRWYPVANATIQHRIRLYDYYEPGMHNTTMYTTFNLFLMNICFACGSYQCPYCPYFNAAAVAQAGIASALLIIAVFTVQRLLLRSGR